VTGLDAPAPPPELRVEVVRSARRRKTVQARRVGEVLQVAIPATMSRAEEDRWVAEMRRRFERRASTERIDLPARADLLARRFRLPRPASIRWVDNQTTRWGSCTSATGTIRVSSAVAAFPDWVVDYVVVHELAHLAVADHSPAFWTLVGRYPLTERARGFLIAKGLDPDP
jgi:predicted metal-dependent hydrolase